VADQDLIEFVRQMDRCWLERRFDDLAAYLAPEIVIVAAGGQRVSGAAAAIESYRDFMSRSDVRAFAASDFIVTESGDAAVVEYAWSMDWVDNDAPHCANGREVLVLARRDRAWRVIWRMQLSDAP
jgi:ketosteroid isomerase-like protein